MVRRECIILIGHWLKDAYYYREEIVSLLSIFSLMRDRSFYIQEGKKQEVCAACFNHTREFWKFPGFKDKWFSLRSEFVKFEGTFVCTVKTFLLSGTITEVGIVHNTGF